jgi:hypothetical protein
MTLDEKIAQARGHVENGRRIVERQRALVARFRSRSSVDLLGLFERTQQIFEADLAALLNRNTPESS